MGVAHMVAKLKLLNGSLLISGNKQQTIQLFKSNRITPKTVKAWGYLAGKCLWR